MGLGLLLGLAACGGGGVKRPTTPSSEGPIVLGDGQELGGPARALGVDDGPRFSGVASVVLGHASCSGSFVVPAGLDLDTDGPAYLLTAGHCVRIGKMPNDVSVDVPLDGYDDVRFRLFGDSPDAAVQVHARRVTFSTMKGRDLAFVELQPTRHALRAQGIVPFVLAETPIANVGEIAYAGHPQHMDPDAPAALGACHQTRRVLLLLEDMWHFYDTGADDCMGVEAGVSGSPVFSLADGRVVGVMSTGVDPAVQPPYPCGLNQPCEAGPEAIHFVPGTNYAAPVDGLGGCFDDTGRFDRAHAGCPLDRGVQMNPAVDQIKVTATPGSPLAVEVPLMASGVTHYRYVVGPAATTDCRTTASYGAVVAQPDAPKIVATVPGEPALLVVCVQAGRGPDPSSANWQDERTPTVITVRIE
jgi:hypothetical protein